jgi:A1 cistron-splicing factor AAR2
MAEGSAAYTVRIDDAEQARRLVETGGSLLLLDVPPSTQFGINQQMFLVGPKFRGLKMLPPGPHFVYYSSKSRYGMDTSPTIGFFLYIRPSQVIVMRWDPQEERIAKLNDSSEVCYTADKYLTLVHSSEV